MLLSLWYLLTYLGLPQTLDLCSLDSSSFEHSFKRFQHFYQLPLLLSFRFLEAFLKCKRYSFLTVLYISFENSNSLGSSVLSWTDLNPVRGPITSLLDMMCDPCILEGFPLYPYAERKLHTILLVKLLNFSTNTCSIMSGSEITINIRRPR